MGKKIIENFNLNVTSVSNLDTNDKTSTRIDKSRYEDQTKTEGMYNTNAGKESKLAFKNSFKLKSNEIVGLKLPSLSDLKNIPTKEGTDVPSPNKITEKQGVDVRNTSQIFGRLAQDAREIEKNYKTPINHQSQSPEVLDFDNTNKLETKGKDKVTPNSIPKKQGVDVPSPNKIAKKQGVDVPSPNDIPEKLATNNLSSYEPTEFDSVDNLSPIYKNDKVNPFDTIGKLENLKSDFNDISKPIDYFDNTHAPGFTKNFESPTKYVEDSSDFDNLSDSHTYTPDNKYLDVMDGLSDGNFPIISTELIKNATNPYDATDTHTNVGPIDKDIPQEVNFLNNSMGGWTHIGRPDINHHMNIGQDLGILSQTQFNVDGVFSIDGEPVRYLQDDGSIAPNSPNAFPMEDFVGRNYDPRTDIPLGSEISNLNEYSGTKSIIRSWQLSPFSNDIDGISQYASSTEGAPSPSFVDQAVYDGFTEETDSASKLYDLVKYDFRSTRSDPWGHITTITKNTYDGTIFDDGFTNINNIVLDGGGLFNSSTNKYITNSGFREQPSVSPIDIATSGNWGNASVIDMTGAGLGYPFVSGSIEKYDITGGTAYNTTGSTQIGSYYSSPSTLNVGSQLGSMASNISMESGSWYYNAALQPNVGYTNDFQNPFDTIYSHTENQRSVTIGTNTTPITGNMLGSGDLVRYSLFGTEMMTTDEGANYNLISHESGSRFDDRMNAYYSPGIAALSRNQEPYESFPMLRNEDARLPADDRERLFRQRLIKFLESPKGILFRSNQIKLYNDAPIGGQGANVADWENIVNGEGGFNNGHYTTTDGPLNVGFEKYYDSVGGPENKGFLGSSLGTKFATNKPFGSFVGVQNVPLDGAYVPDYIDDSNWAEKAVKQAIRLGVSALDRTIKSKTSHKETGGKPRGDFSTLLPMNNGKTMMMAYPTVFKDIESENNFMPFYFKDLRDRSFVFFRGFLSGLNENLTGNWQEESPIGRSEGVHIYQKGSRNLGFSFDLMASTRDELDMIYQKLNKMQSMVYPEYKPDYTMGTGVANAFGSMFGGITGNNAGDTKLRAKAPLVKLRIGELFGRGGNELMGYIQSLSISYPDNATWETARGSRVPKYVKVTVQYRVIHDHAPDMNTQFYGKQTGAQMMVNMITGLASSGGQSFLDWGNKNGMGGFGAGGTGIADSSLNLLGTMDTLENTIEDVINDYNRPIAPKGEEV